MPLKNYSILKGNAVDTQPATGKSPHYQVRVVDGVQSYRIAINVKSSVQPSDLQYILIPDFRHPITDALAELPVGVKHLGKTKRERMDSGVALDYIRGNLFDRTLMKTIKPIAPGPDNDLNDVIDGYISFAMGDESNRIYAFGETWDEPQKPDQYFGFKPGAGIHDIHMNQGSTAAQFAESDGVYQDGGLIVYLADENRYVAYFTKFQSEAWHTDDETGHAIKEPGPTPPHPGPTPPPPPTDHVVRIMSAMVNPVGADPGLETVTLLNVTSAPVPLAGWSLADRAKHKMSLSGTLAAGATLQVKLTRDVQLGNDGGIITLLDNHGLKVHGVSYTKAQASREGVSIVF